MIRGGCPEIRIAGEMCGNLVSNPGEPFYIGHATADPRRQGRSMKFDSDTPIADPYDAALKMLDIVRVSNKTLLDAGRELAAALERVGKPDDLK